MIDNEMNEMNELLFNEIFIVNLFIIIIIHHQCSFIIQVINTYIIQYIYIYEQRDTHDKNILSF